MSINAWTLGSLGTRFHWAGDERGRALIEKAMKIDPFLPGIFNYPTAGHHFERGEYQEALTAARKVNLPGFFPTQAQLAAIYAELGREREDRSAVEELLRLQPGHTIEKTVEDTAKDKLPDGFQGGFAALLNSNRLDPRCLRTPFLYQLPGRFIDSPGIRRFAGRRHQFRGVRAAHFYPLRDDDNVLGE